MNNFIVAAYVLLCILLGGSTQIPWTNLGLQIVGILILAWAAAGPRPPDSDSRFSVPDILLILGLILVLLQLIPIPEGAWASLPGREALAHSVARLGIEFPTMTVSETPYGSVETVFAAIPAMAAFAATERLAPSPRLIAAAIVAGMVLGVLLGAVQVAGGPGSWAYFYEITNSGAVGFFANSNHMATLLLASIPLGAALLGSSSADRRSSTAGRYAVGIALLGLVLLGVMLNRSLAALLLVIPILIASFTLIPAGYKWRRFALPVTGIALGAAIAMLASNPIASTEIQSNAATAVNSRSEIWNVTVRAIKDNFPVGTGLGSFGQVYRQYENPDSVTLEYINHAHNDYLEFALELGASGIILIVLFLAWWSVAAVRIWTSQLSTRFTRAATIVTAAVLAHSFVDFPLRTAAIAAIFGAMTGLMAQHPRIAGSNSEAGTRGSRHVQLG